MRASPIEVTFGVLIGFGWICNQDSSANAWTRLCICPQDIVLYSRVCVEWWWEDADNLTPKIARKDCKGFHHRWSSTSYEVMNQKDLCLGLQAFSSTVPCVQALLFVAPPATSEGSYDLPCKGMPMIEIWIWLCRRLESYNYAVPVLCLQQPCSFGELQMRFSDRKSVV